MILDDHAFALLRDPSTPTQTLIEGYTALVRAFRPWDITKDQFGTVLDIQQWRASLAPLARFIDTLGKNPQTPRQVLSWIARVSPAALGENPVLPLLEIENPNFLYGLFESDIQTYPRASLAGEVEQLMGGSQFQLAWPTARYYVAKDPENPWTWIRAFTNGRIAMRQDGEKLARQENTDRFTINPIGTNEVLLLENEESLLEHVQRLELADSLEELWSQYDLQSGTVGRYELPALGEGLSRLTEEQINEYLALWWVSPDLIARDDAYDTTWKLILLEHPDLVKRVDEILPAETATMYLADQQTDMTRAQFFGEMVDALLSYLLDVMLDCVPRARPSIEAARASTDPQEQSRLVHLIRDIAATDYAQVVTTQLDFSERPYLGYISAVAVSTLARLGKSDEDNVSAVLGYLEEIAFNPRRTNPSAPKKILDWVRHYLYQIALRGMEPAQVGARRISSIPDASKKQLDGLVKRNPAQAIQHPNLSRDVFSRLMQEYPLEGLKNPALPLWILEDPSWWRELQASWAGRWIWTEGGEHSSRQLTRQQGRLFLADCLEHLLPLYEDVYRNDRLTSVIAKMRGHALTPAQEQEIHHFYEWVNHFSIAAGASDWREGVEALQDFLKERARASQERIDEEKLWQWHRLLHYLAPELAPVPDQVGVAFQPSSALPRTDLSYSDLFSESGPAQYLDRWHTLWFMRQATERLILPVMRQHSLRGISLVEEAILAADRMLETNNFALPWERAYNSLYTQLVIINEQGYNNRKDGYLQRAASYLVHMTHRPVSDLNGFVMYWQFAMEAFEELSATASPDRTRPVREPLAKIFYAALDQNVQRAEEMARVMDYPAFEDASPWEEVQALLVREQMRQCLAFLQENKPTGKVQQMLHLVQEELHRATNPRYVIRRVTLGEINKKYFYANERAFLLVRWYCDQFFNGAPDPGLVNALRAVKDAKL